MSFLTFFIIFPFDYVIKLIKFRAIPETRSVNVDNIKNFEDAISEIFFLKKKQEDLEHHQQVLIHRVWNLIDENKRLCIDLMKTKEEFQRNIYFI